MNPRSLRSSALLLLGLCFAPAPISAQNIASNFGASGQNRDRLTLLPGPSLLSPGRGIGLPVVDGAGTVLPAIASERSPTFRFVPGRFHARPTQGTLFLVPERQLGVKPMTFDSAPPRAMPLARPTAPLPAVGELHFDAKLPPAPPPALKRE